MIVAGSLYIIYLAVKLYRLQPNTIEQNVVAHRFQDGLLVTLFNPKFYMMVTAVFAQFVDLQKSNASVVLFGFIFILLAAHIAWLGLGKVLQGARSTRHFRLLNKTMGALLFLFGLYFLYQVRCFPAGQVCV